jgi:hypothetical protein
MKLLGYNLRPVTRYVLTRSWSSDAGERFEPEVIAEFTNEAKAREAMSALQAVTLERT